VSITVPSSAPRSDEFYYVILSAWDNNGSYNQIGFADDYGIWGLSYSWTTGPLDNLTYNYSPNALALSLGVTYTFYITTQSGVTSFAAYQSSNLVWSLDAPTGGDYLVLSYLYSGVYDYTDYEEVWQTSTPGGSPAFDFYFYNNYWTSTNGTSIAATWTPFYANAPDEVPDGVTVVISGNSVLVKNPRERWPMFHHDLWHNGYSTSTAPNTNQTLWTYTTGGGVSSSPAVAGGFVYVGSADNRTYALNATTGALIWSFTTGSWVRSSPAVAGGVVYVGSCDNRTYALNATTGAQVWSFTTGSWVESSPAVAGGVVYVGSDDGNVYALNATTGALIWSFTTGSYVMSSPAVAGGVVYVGSYWADNVYALNATTGALIWSYTTGSYVYSSPAVAGGFVYVGSADNRTYALNATTGAQVWSFTTGNSVVSSPAVAGGVVYVASFDGKVYALNATTGALIWSYTTGSYVYSSPAVAGGFVYVGSTNGNFYALNATTGAYIWSYTTGGVVDSSPAVAGGKVYVGSNDGNVYAFGVHDVAVTNVAPSKTVVGQGFSASINVTAANQGSYTETFNVTAYCNLTGYTQPPGLVGYWKLDEGSGTTAYDSSGYNNHGIIYGASWTSGKVNSALSFDGVDDYVDCGTDPSLMPTTAITLETWFKASDVNTYATIVSTFYYEGYFLRINPNAGIEFAPGICYSPPGTIQPGVWYHVVGTFDGTSKIYVNGKLVSSQGAGYLAYTGQSLRIGNNPTTGFWFNGIIDEVKIYNRALSAEEIWAEYTRTGGRFSIQTQSVTLEAGASAPVTFTWNTTGFAYGNYTISAYAWPVPGETDTADNNCTCSVPVHVGVPGDVSGTTPGVYDGIVNMKDIAYLVSLFQTKPSKPPWYPNADVNNDGVVDMKDIAIAVYYFNQHE
jgi:outer membrane protein assembly factor BamB